MTAEVAVMNRIGVALAADSAVAIGPTADKIYTSAEKLFQLSTVDPIGVMVYGNASFMSLPWETIIKSLRIKLGSQRFDTVEDFGSRIIRYLTHNEDVFPLSIQHRQVDVLILSFFFHIRELLRKAIDEEIRKKGSEPIPEADLPAIFAPVIRSRLDDVKSANRIDACSADLVQTIRESHRSRIENARHQVFENLPLSDSSKQELLELAVEMLTRQYFGPLKCGLVVAGFGDKEYLPALYSYELEEMIEGIPRLKPMERHCVGVDSEGCILAFAQQESVHQFLQGIDQQFEHFIQESTNRIVTGAVAAILDKLAGVDADLANQLRETVEPEVAQMLQSLFQDWANRKKQYWEPILDVVSILPKDELAAMAESLVNLTKFRRRVTPQRETVGGPIDVAVITKGDGFVWLRRKHYFDPDLNPRVMARFAKET
jgi:hypothetical protein